jgi:hypothetical protein
MGNLAVKDNLFIQILVFIQAHLKMGNHKDMVNIFNLKNNN